MDIEVEIIKEELQFEESKVCVMAENVDEVISTYGVYQNKKILENTIKEESDDEDMWETNIDTKEEKVVLEVKEESSSDEMYEGYLSKIKTEELMLKSEDGDSETGSATDLEESIGYDEEEMWEKNINTKEEKVVLEIKEGFSSDNKGEDSLPDIKTEELMLKSESEDDSSKTGFPQTSYKLEQRTRWIAAVKRISTDGSSWSPGPNDLICSAHFVGNKKSEEQASPSYVPSIFPTVYKSRNVDEEAAENRHDRFIKRRFKKKEESVVEAPVLSVDQMELDTDYVVNELTVESETEKKCIDQECQVNIFLKENMLNDNTLVCNRYIFNGSSVSDAETQTDINKCKIDVKIIEEKVYKDKKCGTVEKIFVDQAVGLDFQIKNNHTNKKHFNGYESIKNNEQLIDLAGVSVNNFNFLLKRITVADRCVISKEDRLLIFLTKMKTGLTFSAMSVFFAVHRTTISKIFYSTLQQLAGATAELVFWPDKNTVQETMPACFHPNYTKTRVIIDCTEFKIEIPASVDYRVYTYSHYKKGFTAKLLIGITPSGFISLVSKVAGGRKSDSQMTIESGLIDLLDDGDVVLADKGFPDIQKTIDQSGKAVLLVMPPFLGKKVNSQKKRLQILTILPE